MMFTPWGPSAVPTGGAGVAAPACSCTLTSAAIFLLFGGISFYLSLVVMTRAYDALCHLLLSLLFSDFLDLAEAQLDGGLPAEDLDERLHALRLGVDLGDGRVQG